MRKMYMLLCVVLLTPVSLLGTLLEADRFEQIFPLVDGSTLVLIDLDNTLYESELMLGSAPWRSYFRKKMERLEIPEEHQEHLLNVHWDFLQQAIPVRLVDPAAAAMINQLRKQGILVFGFTARAKREVLHTTRQLEELGVRFTPFSAPLFDLPEKNAAFEGGVIYCGDYAKEEALRAFLNYLQLFASGCTTAQTILVMDDHEHSILACEPVAASFNLKYIGVRFRGTDERSALFNPAIVEYQWEHLPLITSDSAVQEKIVCTSSG
jgi:hypothetical protein